MENRPAVNRAALRVCFNAGDYAAALRRRQPSRLPLAVFI
jgi:hypothetical protein